MPRGVAYPPSAGGGPPGAVEVKLIEVNLGGPLARFSGSFTIADPAITAGQHIPVWLAPGPYTGKGTLADESSMYPGITFTGVPAAGSMLTRWSAPKGAVAKGNIKVYYLIG